MQKKREAQSTAKMKNQEPADDSRMDSDAELVQPTETSTAPSEPNDSRVQGLVEDLEKERERSSEYLKRLQYLQADFENYRKRAEREMSDVKRYGNDRLLADLLVVVDELELGLDRAKEQGESPALVEGMGMVLKRFQNLLAKEGVARIEGIGTKFDPSRHEAAIRVPSEKEEGIIVEEIRPGYMLKGRVLRPSIVKVSEGSQKDAPENVPNNTENMVKEEE